VKERGVFQRAVKTFIELAECIGIQQSAVSKAKNKGEFPPKWIFIVADKFDLSSDWLRKGEGPKILNIKALAANDHQIKYVYPQDDFCKQFAKGSNNYEVLQGDFCEAINVLLENDKRTFFKHAIEILTQAEEIQQNGHSLPQKKSGKQRVRRWA
jgi:hypothetical protein